MTLEYKHLLNPDFHPSSKVWIYQCSRLFSLNEALVIEKLLEEFVQQWKSHGQPVKGEAHLFFGRFIVLLADESETGVGGCSTDTSVRFIKGIEQQFNVTLLDRTTLAFATKDKSGSYQVQLLPFSQLQYAFTNGFINGDTLYFNNLVQTKKELEDKWMAPVKESWLAQKFFSPGMTL